MKSNPTVFVGLSGGVDSSVAALRLIKQGYNVVGVFIKVWHPDFMICNWEAERLDAMRVAAHLGIPFLTCDAVDTYRDEVAKYFISEYRAGRTPNPDVLCNKEVKFGAFIRFARERNADYIATGHYVQKITAGGTAELHRGVDTNKDQSYFLWSLSPEQLAYSLFPVGDSPKEQIRKEAAAANIPTATKKDSQGVCFLGHIDIPEFLSHYIDLVPGDVLNEAGIIIGTHQSALVYTTGQRHGFTISDKNTNRQQLYVVSRDITKNTITVSETLKLTDSSAYMTLINHTFRTQIQPGESAEVQFRYRQTPIPIVVESITRDAIVIKPSVATDYPASGQSAVVYRNNLCLGGGIVM
jgi:tRNA-specific 2-thiouridylase